jgi:hypothetical protein
MLTKKEWPPATKVIVAAGLIIFAVNISREIGPVLWGRLFPAPESRTMKVLRENYPEEYKRIIATANTTGGRSEVDAINATASVSRQLLGRQLPFATAVNVRAFVTIERDRLAAVSSKSPLACGQIALGVAVGDDPRSLVPPEILTRSGSATAALLEQTARAPTPPSLPISSAERQALLDGAYEDSPKPDQPELVAWQANPASPTPRQTEAVCHFYIATLNRILALPEAEGARLYKGLNAN